MFAFTQGITYGYALIFEYIPWSYDDYEGITQITHVAAKVTQGSYYMYMYTLMIRSNRS